MLDLDAVVPLLFNKVLVFTGAGISVPSGLPTFRGKGGLYEGENVYKLATPEGFFENPALVWNWYLYRIKKSIGAKPNKAHYGLVELENIAERFSLITSNVDDLHERAGSKNLFKLHGNILETKCTKCGNVEKLILDNFQKHFSKTNLPLCNCSGLLRPNVVWFGEYPDQKAIAQAQYELPSANIVLEIGQSGVVHYGFSEMAIMLGIPLIRINPGGYENHHGILHMKSSADIAVETIVNRLKLYKKRLTPR